MNKIIIFFKKYYFLILVILLLCITVFMYIYNQYLYNDVNKSIYNIYDVIIKSINISEHNIKLSFNTYIDNEYKLKLEHIKSITDAHEVLIKNNTKNIDNIKVID
ncbi:hypothetical protein CHREV_214 [Choristoneura rosaceana entomopoxvirus 'L']|uniref:Uncharacterized protein n=1 Tax=Choristoneura rosaceana entomopoxvirus 'L' TaxID=1293539 RepID=A0ABM9QKR8_9POXV|nr:hypothetical protein CHREV_214 [Choristoneura rosaceana entomopoxvirus 'L']CCU56116.1 hypothetical protein CHREV_214 [Choristoneura rosaceana entomopoxvirus 'L']